MPDVQIQNAGGVWGQAAQPNPQTTDLLNNTAGTLFPGDVVVVGADGVTANTSTTVNDKTVVGVVAARTPSDSQSTQPAGSGYASGQSMNVVFAGPGRINIGANTVAAGDLLTTSASAKVAATNAGTPAANAVTGSIIAVALEASGAKDGNNTVRAWIGKM